MSHITIFAIPASFEGKRKIQQDNAIQSWKLLEPEPEIILFGDDPGVNDAAMRFDCRHISKIARDEYGTPLISDAFQKAQTQSNYVTLCYINSDIIILGGLMEAADICLAAWQQFLITGQRWDAVRLEEYPIDFSNSNWRDDVRQVARSKGGYHSRRGEDWFCFKRGLYQRVPPFAVGRSAWDNWLVFDVTKREIPTIDATSFVEAIHQGTGKYRHPTKSPEYRYNQRVWREAGGILDAGYTSSTSWILRPTGLELRKDRARWKP